MPLVPPTDVHDHPEPSLLTLTGSPESVVRQPGVRQIKNFHNNHMILKTRNIKKQDVGKY